MCDIRVVLKCFTTFWLLLLVIATQCVCINAVTVLEDTEKTLPLVPPPSSSSNISNIFLNPDGGPSFTENTSSLESSTTVTSSFGLRPESSSTLSSVESIFSNDSSASYYLSTSSTTKSPDLISDTPLISSHHTSTSVSLPSSSDSYTSSSEESDGVYSGDVSDEFSDPFSDDEDSDVLAPVEFHERCPEQCFCFDLNVDCRMSGLSTVPSYLPSHLHHLDLHGNDIREIGPDTLKKLTHLRTLNLRRNRNITIAPRAFENNLHLQQIDLSSCHLKKIPEFHLPTKNVSISLAYNNIDTLDWSVFSQRFYYQLRRLDLSHNLLRHLSSSSASKSPHLHTLILSWNGIHDIANASFVGLSGIRELSLSHNRLQSLNTLALQGLDTLQRLDLSGNRLSNISDNWLKNLSSLKSLNLSANNVSVIDSATTWQHCASLNRLDLSNNRLTSVTSQMLTGLNHLSTLILSNNQLSNIDADAFLHVPHLKILRLNNNRLSHLLSENTTIFAPLQRLSLLSLVENSITSLGQTTFTGLASLRVLQLGETQLSALSESSIRGEMVELQDLQLSSEKLICDCRLKWLADFWREKQLTADVRQVVLADSDKQLICSGPDNLAGISFLQLTSHQICNITTTTNNNNINDEDIIATDSEINQTRSSLPVITEHPIPSVIAKPGTNLTLSCSVETADTSSLHMHWYRDGHKLTPGAVHTNATTNGSVSSAPRDGDTVVEVRNWASLSVKGSEDQSQMLSILYLYNAKQKDVGRYWCSAGNKYGATRSDPANIQFHVFPSFVERPENSQVQIGDSARFSCSASGTPTPIITWSKLALDKFSTSDEFVTIPTTGLNHLYVNDSHLEIANVSRDDQGVYMCSVNNSAGLITAKAKLTVVVTPKFLKKMADLHASPNSVAVLNCPVIGSPEPDIIWLKNNQPLFAEGRSNYAKGWSNDAKGWSNDNKRRSIQFNGRSVSSSQRVFVLANAYTLVIMDVSANDSGIYSCRANNSVGVAEMSASLFISQPADTWSVLACGAIFALPMVAAVLIVAVACLLLAKRSRSKKHITSTRRNCRNDRSDVLAAAGRSSCMEMNQREDSCPDQLQQLLAMTKPAESGVVPPVTSCAVKAGVPCGVYGAVVMARDDGSEHSKDSGQSGHEATDPSWLVATTNDGDSQQQVALLSSCANGEVQGVYGSSTAPRVLTTFKSTNNTASLGRGNNSARGSLQNIVPRHLYADRRLSQLSQQRCSIAE